MERIDWFDTMQAGPAFLTIVLIPATGNVAYGVFAGLAATIVLGLAHACISKLRSVCGGSGGAAGTNDDTVYTPGGSSTDQMTEQDLVRLRRLLSGTSIASPAFDVVSTSGASIAAPAFEVVSTMRYTHGEDQS